MDGVTIARSAAEGAAVGVRTLHHLTLSRPEPWTPEREDLTDVDRVNSMTAGHAATHAVMHPPTGWTGPPPARRYSPDVKGSRRRGVNTGAAGDFGGTLDTP